MDRYNFEEYISAYLDDELSIDEKKEFEQIISLHSECKNKFDEVKSLIENLNQMPQAKTSANFMNKLQDRIDSHNQPEDTVLDKISNFLLGPKAKPVYGFGMSIAVILILFTSINQENSNLTNTSVKNSIAIEEYQNEEIAYEPMDEEEDSINMNDIDSNIPINQVKGQKISD